MIGQVTSDTDEESSRQYLQFKRMVIGGSANDDGDSPLVQAERTFLNSLSEIERPIDGLRQKLLQVRTQADSEAQKVAIDICKRQIDRLLTLKDSIESKMRQSADSSMRSGPVFAFRDGVLTSSIQNGGVILLEDFDLPQQSVTERCNSLFEPDPEFYLAVSIGATNCSVCATIHSQLTQ